MVDSTPRSSGLQLGVVIAPREAVLRLALAKEPPSEEVSGEKRIEFFGVSITAKLHEVINPAAHDF
jgi:hypothetical protein